MTNSTDIHPDAVFGALLAKGGRSQRTNTLNRLHDICRRQHEGSKDFSIAAIGRICESEGVMKGRALYNAASADYVQLLTAWSTYAGPPSSVRPKAKPLASDDFLMRIEDPAIRSIMQATTAERNKLRAQVNLLKSKTVVTVDRRPLGATVVAASPTETVAVLTMSAQLNDSERSALESAISPGFLEAQGWREGSHGEVVTDQGRTVFDVGFARAIRKVLGLRLSDAS